MRFVLINDLHLSHRTPASRTDDYVETLFGKLGQVTAVAKKIQATAVCIAGDIFHDKGRVPYQLLIRVMDWCFDLQQAGIDVLAIPGNHDLAYDRYESLSSQPLGVIIRSGAKTKVSFTARVYDRGDARAAVAGIPFPQAESRSEFDRLLDLRLVGVHGAILLAHCFATVEGGHYFGDHVHQFADLQSLPFNVFHFGHDHRDHGVVALGGQYFVAVGALARGTLTRDELARTPKLVLVDVQPSGVTVQSVRLQVRPVAEVFDLSLHAALQRERDAVEQFVQQLAATLDHSHGAGYQTHLAAMALPDDVRRRVDDYLARAEAA